MAEVVQFLWSRGAFGWCEGRCVETDRPGRWLVLRGKSESTPYQPLEDEPVLFRTFADVKDTESGVQEFAKSFGWLGTGDQIIETRRRGRSLLESGERLVYWRQAILTMREATALWDALLKDDWPALRKRITLTNQEGGGMAAVYVGQHLRGVKAVITNGRIRANWQRHLVGPLHKRYSRAGWLQLQRFVNRRLERSFAPRLLVGDSDRPQIYLVPQHLHGALWWQFAQAVDSGRTHRHCDQCGKWVEISWSTGGRRSHARFCSDSCRVRHSQQQKRRAQQLWKDGVSLKEITKRVDGREATVRRWTSGLPRGRPRRQGTEVLGD